MNSTVRLALPRAVLFDLDGTLLDSAPDMLAAANTVLRSEGRSETTLATIRPYVSQGSRAMLAAAFPEDDATFRDALVPRFLHAYQAAIGRYGRLFSGVTAVIEALETRALPWGIVTNKPEYLARQVVAELGWEQRCVVLIGGDTVAHNKPHPLPLLTAAEAIGVVAAECHYVGDDSRDMAAARSAGMSAILALWGYRSAAERPERWGADLMVAQPLDLMAVYGLSAG